MCASPMPGNDLDGHTACAPVQGCDKLCCLTQTADFGPKTALRVVDAIREDIRAGRVKTRADVRRAGPPLTCSSTGRVSVQQALCCSAPSLAEQPWWVACIRSKLKESIVAVLTASGKSSDLQFGDAKPAVLLIVGVNGGGKTTTIGKLAHKLGQEGAQACMLAL